MRNLLLLIIIPFISVSTFGQIDIHINGFYERVIQLTELNNALTKSFNVLASDTISSNGIASFDYNIQTPKYYEIRVDNRSTSILLEPGVAYAIEIEAPKYQQIAKAPIQVIGISASGERQLFLHEEWSKYQQDLATFIADNPTLSSDSSKSHLVDSLSTSLLQRYNQAIIDYPWFNRSIKCQLGMLKKNALTYSDLLDSCALSQFAISDPIYLEAFRLSSQKQVNQWLFKHHNELRSLASSDELLDSIFIWLDLDSVLVDFHLHQELIIASLAYEKSLPGLTLTNRLKLLKKLGYNTNNPQIESLCKDAYEQLSKLIPNTKAPELVVFDQRGNEVSLSQFAGKFIYLQFWNEKNTASILDLKLIDRIRKTYKKNIFFLSIHIGEDEIVLEEYLNKHDINWPVYHISEDDPIVIEYNVETTPMYYLIDPNGYLLRAPAERPNRLYPLFDAINDSQVSSIKSYEIIRTYDD